MHLQESRTSKFPGGACPRTPLGSKPLWAFGKYTRLLLLSTHLCKNLLKPLQSAIQQSTAEPFSVANLPNVVHCFLNLWITRSVRNKLLRAL